MEVEALVSSNPLLALAVAVLGGWALRHWNWIAPKLPFKLDEATLALIANAVAGKLTNPVKKEEEKK